MTYEEIMARAYHVDTYGHAIVSGMTGHPLARKDGSVRRNRLVVWEVNGPFDPSLIVHHEDRNRLNDDPANLVLIEWGKHTAEHLIGNTYAKVHAGRTVTWGDKISAAKIGGSMKCRVCGKRNSSALGHRKHVVRWAQYPAEQVA